MFSPILMGRMVHNACWMNRLYSIFPYNFRCLTKISCLLGFALICCSAMADRLIFIPVGKKVPFKAIKLNYMWDSENSDLNRSTLTAGIGVSFEFAATTNSNFLGDNDSIFDLSYSIADPLVDYAPGIAVGIRDIENSSEIGRYVYVALTFRQGQSGVWNGEYPAEATIGIKYGAHGPQLMMGGYVPLASFLAIVAEIDHDRAIGGFELKLMPDLEVRCLHRSGLKLYSASYQVRF